MDKSPLRGLNPLDVVSCDGAIGDIMPRDDWTRITLRLPPQLHARLTEIARQNASSLNQEIVTILYSTVGTDVWAEKLASLAAEDLINELDRMTAENRLRTAELEKRMDAADAAIKKILPTLPDDDTPEPVRPKAGPRIRAAVANDDLPPDIPVRKSKRSDPRKKKGAA